MELYLPEDHYEATIALSALTRNPDLQVRYMVPRIQQQVVDYYRKLYEDGRDLGPLTVVTEVNDAGIPTGSILLADGNQRYEALVQMGRTEAACIVYTGDDFTAVLIAARENGGRGLPLELYDRKQAARTLLIEVMMILPPGAPSPLSNSTQLNRLAVRWIAYGLMGLQLDRLSQDYAGDSGVTADRPTHQPMCCRCVRSRPRLSFRRPMRRPRSSFSGGPTLCWPRRVTNRETYR